ncbi:hypothetical protein AVEN_34682-1 [Araneus ventricosus]|uniref:Uncharacterized protein n=1 Tax=Araneus ventricosus TaxID=182803 RepID=A0A4Y2B395_ARAVE|nr:hypothetical protein AVEN_34682-1 [Araneus ventricosus]
MDGGHTHCVRYILRELDCPQRQSQNHHLGSCAITFPSMVTFPSRYNASDLSSAGIFLLNSPETAEYCSIGIISLRFVIATRMDYPRPCWLWRGVHALLERDQTKLTDSFSVES